MHEFEIGGVHYGVPQPDFDFGKEIVPEKTARLGKCLAGARSVRYTCDFGDDWAHTT